VGSSASSDQKLASLQGDVKNLSAVVQRFVDEHLQDQLVLVRSKNKPFEAKIDALEWLSRYANFYAPESVYALLTAFKDIYTSNDMAYRNAYIQAQHSSDAVVLLVAAVKSEVNKMTLDSSSPAFPRNLSGSSAVVMQSSETRIAFYLNIMEPLLVNNLNSSLALQSGLLELVVALLRTQEISRTMNQQSIPLRPYIKFALRCLTSAIRTEVAVNRFYGIEGGVSKVLEILEFVEDQELIANSCKIIRICLRDDTVYDKIATQYSGLANLIVEKMIRWSNSLPIVQESTSAIRNYVRKVEFCQMMRADSVDAMIDLARDPRFDKIKTVITQALKLMQRVPQFDQKIRAKGALDLVTSP